MARALFLGCMMTTSSIVILGAAQRLDVFVESRDVPAIKYSTAPVRDPVAVLKAKLAAGSVRLTHDPEAGYLPSVLDALDISPESQALVFSQASAQAQLIGFHNPRAIYFNETTAVGWVRGATRLELAAHDPEQGVIFYTLEQKSAGPPAIAREDGCLQCHLAWETLGVPGMMMLSTFRMPDDPNAYASGVVVDHRTPMTDRWGGWFVTGRPGTTVHQGNVPVLVSQEEFAKAPPPTPQLETVANLFDLRGYPNACSDIAALMVLAHQTRMTNLITRTGWEARLAAAAPRAVPADAVPVRIDAAVRELVDYMLFVDEAPLAGPIEPSCGFAKWFSSRGPRDRLGRSLYQLDLRRRLQRYPLSYMIYTPAFDALPASAKIAVYRTLWTVLSIEDKAPKYRHLDRADRLAILQILRDTRTDLPEELAVEHRRGDAAPATRPLK